MVFRRSPIPGADVEHAGGAHVRRAFDFGDRKLVSGDNLSRDELATIPERNLVALVNTGKLELWPQAPSDMYIADRFIVPAGRNRYHVIEGRRLTRKSVSKEEAHALKAKG